MSIELKHNFDHFLIILDSLCTDQLYNFGLQIRSGVFPLDEFVENKFLEVLQFNTLFFVVRYFVENFMSFLTIV